MHHPQLDPHRQQARARRLPLRGGCVVLGMLAAAACVEDTLYPEDADGPRLTVAPHQLSVRASVPPRAELGELVQVAVTARSREGASGIAEIGATALVVNAARGDTVVVRLGPERVEPAQTGPVTRTFPLRLSPELVDRRRLPGTLSVEVHAYALTAAGSCAAAVEEAEQQLPCGSLRGERVASGVAGRARPVTVVEGTTIPLPGGVGAVGDMVVDNRTGKVFLSNRAAHRVEVLDARTLAFASAIAVGSEPWGLAMGRTGDTLLVANSGGTNVSLVPTAQLREAVERRFEIPRVTLYEVEFKVDSVTQTTTYTDLRFYNFADRPQFVTQDAAGRLLYSAAGTRAAPEGTIRLAEWQPGWQTWDARLLFHNRAIERDSSAFAIANADNVDVVSDSLVVVTDHVPGTVPAVVVSSDPLPVPRAVPQLRARCLALAGRECDVAYYTGAWRVPRSVEVGDTTLVAVSGDRRWVAFGEGVERAAGRIILWNADGGGTLSRVEDIQDLVNNTSDRLSGLELNQSGSLGVARGRDAAYFFGNNLRLQGLARQPATPDSAAAGVAFLPGGTGNRTLAFVGTGAASIRIVETTGYTGVGEIAIRNRVVGPFRVAAPLPGSRACPTDPAAWPPRGSAEADCLVARIYAVTASRGVVVVDVARRHLP